MRAFPAGLLGEPAKEDFADYGGIGLPLGELHDLALEEIERGLLARLVIGHGIRIGGDHLVTECLDRPGVADLLEALFLDDHGGRLVACHHFGKDLLALTAADHSALDEEREFADRGGLDRAVRDVQGGGAKRAQQIIDDPVGDALRLRGTLGGLFKVIGQLRVVGKHRRIIAADAVVGLKALALGLG